MPSPTAPYDMLEAVLNTARVRVNDAIVAIGGDVVKDTSVFTLTLVNAAWRRLQELLANYGLPALNREVALASVPICASADQGVRVWFDWTGYWDGTVLQAAPVFPQDMIGPLLLSERAHGSTGNYNEMDEVLNGLPTVPKRALNKIWEWRQEKIYMPGATAVTDMLLRYAGFLPDFVDPGTTLFTLQPVQIMRCLSPFAWFICSEVAHPRGDLDAGAFDQKAITEAEQIYNRDSLQDRALYKPSELGKMPDRFTPQKGMAGPRGPQKE